MYWKKCIEFNSEVDGQTEDWKMNIPYGMPAFIIVTNTGSIRVCYYRSFGDELWCFLSSKLRIPVYSGNTDSAYGSNALLANVDFAMQNRKIQRNSYLLTFQKKSNWLQVFPMGMLYVCMIFN